MISMMNIEKIILKMTTANSINDVEYIQNLWSGYGSIMRYELDGGQIDSVIAKHIGLVNKQKHLTGWNTDLSHKRKVKSYKVETAWYNNWSQQCGKGCRVAKCFGIEHQGDEVLIVLEDLDDSGFFLRKRYVNWRDVEACLRWLACFHATFLGERPTHLWKVGTYWHLDTRPDELKALKDDSLKKMAGRIDQRLKKCPYQTFVHGDAKLANFCFSKEGPVAMVDFQYVGRGCGMKDVAYLMGDCFSESEYIEVESQVLEFYFSVLKQECVMKNKQIDFRSLEKEWRHLFPWAWVDFYRFMKGWAPEYCGASAYTDLMIQRVIEGMN